jgi:Glycosyl transferase family 2
MMSAADPRAAIVVPTHDHAATLDLAVRSALEQTVTEIEVIVVGDGVGDDTREVVSMLAEGDPRVRFMDFPKGPHHGEIYRGRAVAATKAAIVTYLCDDDLLLPDHVESMSQLLAEADLAHSQNGHLNPDGSWQPYLADLSSPAFRAWMLQPGNNAVSLTGTAHTVTAYERLPHGWRTTPPGQWADHYMWQQFLAEPWIRAVTATRVTALQFPSHLDGRGEWQPQRRRAELEAWRTTLAAKEGRAQLETAVRRAVLNQAAEQWELREHFEGALGASEQARDQLEAHAGRLAEQLDGIESTRTWRLREALRRLGPVRALARATRRRR